ncbi:MAG: hypothetical protein AAB600_02470 [Patescibacteria group bacterium]
MRILDRLEQNKTTWFMLIILFFFFLLRLPSLFEPYWYGDEGVYQTLGNAIKNDRLLYRDIWDNKPPFIYLLYSVFNSDQFATKLASLIAGLLSILVFFFLAKKLFSPPAGGLKICYFVTVIFAILFGLPLIEGNIANAENFMLLPVITSALLILYTTRDRSIHKTSSHKKSSYSYLMLNTYSYYLIPLSAGLLLSFAFLFKVVAIFDFTAFVVFVAIVRLGKRLSLKNIKNIKNQIISVSVGFIAPIILTTLFFLINGGLKDFLQATFIQNVGYVGYGNKFLIPQGLLLLKAVFLSVFILYIFKIRKILSLTTIFILIWFAFSLFNAFFAKRPFPHYLLVLLPSFSLILGLIFWDKKYQKIITLFLLIAMVFVFSNFHFFDKSIAYYKNFIMFIADKKSITSYETFFDKKTPIDYEIALFLKPKIRKNDSIFIWGNNPQVYKMVGVLPPGKYVVAYHITGYKDGILNTKNSISKVKPKFIVIMPDQHTVPFSLSGYFPRIKIGNALIYERIL